MIELPEYQDFLSRAVETVTTGQQVVPHNSDGSQTSCRLADLVLTFDIHNGGDSLHLDVGVRHTEKIGNEEFAEERRYVRECLGRRLFEMEGSPYKRLEKRLPGFEKVFPRMETSGHEGDWNIRFEIGELTDRVGDARKKFITAFTSYVLKPLLLMSKPYRKQLTDLVNSSSDE